MRFIELFDSRDKKKRLSHIRNLVMLSAIDGEVSKEEVDLVFKIGIRAGISPDELNRILLRPNSIAFVPPDSYRERIEQLYDLVMVMMIDGEFHKHEIILCKTIAEKIGFRHQIIDAIVEDICKLIAEGIATDIALERLFKSFGDI